MRGHGPDRRALRDRRARRRRDHQHRPGSPRAARARSRRSPRPRRRSLRACGTTAARWSPRTPRRWSRTCAGRLETITFGPGGDVFARSSRRSRATDAGADRDARRARRSSACLRRDPQPDQRALRGRDRRRARRRAAEMAALAPRHSVLPPARRADRAARADRAGERLLQRQPDLDARRARAPRRSRGAPDAGSRSSAGWASSGPTARPSTARSARSSASWASTPLIGVGELARDYAPDEWAPDAATRPPRSPRACSAPATPSSSRARARSAWSASPMDCGPRSAMAT